MKHARLIFWAVTLILAFSATWGAYKSQERAEGYKKATSVSDCDPPAALEKFLRFCL